MILWVLFGVAGVAAAVFLIRVNIQYQRDLKAMSPEEREKYREDEDRDLSIW